MTPVTYEQIINGARARLKDEGERIAGAPHPFQATWWSGEPTFEQQLASDFGLPAPIPDIEEDFRAEVSAIREVLSDCGHTPELADWQKGAKNPANKMWSALNLHAEALSIWDEVGVPVRRRGELVFRIVAPRDVMGSPVVHAMQIDDYVTAVAAKTADDAATIARLEKRLHSWRTASVGLGVILVVLLMWSLT